MHRPRVVLCVTPRLFRDTLSRALAPHADVAVAPDDDSDLTTWMGDREPFDLLVVCTARCRPDVARRVVAIGDPTTVPTEVPEVRTLDDLVAELTRRDVAPSAAGGRVQPT